MAGQEFRTIESLKHVRDNTVLVDGDTTLKNTVVEFHGVDNILHLHGPVHLDGARLRFYGDGSVIHICQSKRTFRACVNIWHSGTFHIGQDHSFNGASSVISISERSYVFIGDDAMFSQSVVIRTADPHLIFDCESGQRINPTKPVIIGDHVWLGQEVNVLKGVTIGSGSILAAGAMITKTLPSNAVAGGNPARVIKTGVFWSRTTVHAFRPLDTEASQHMSPTQFTYLPDNTDVLTHLRSRLTSETTAQQRNDFLLEFDSLLTHGRLAVA